MELTRTQMVTTSAICAALYALAKTATTFVPTPWGVGQFAPGVIVPAFFAVVSPPLVAAIGAGVGVFVGDLALTAFRLTDPLLSLIAGVPANFVGVFLLSWLVHRRGSWRTFVWATIVSLSVGNLIAASVVAPYAAYVYRIFALDVIPAVALGLTVFWLITMVPFVIPIVPVLVRAATPLRGRIVAIQIPEWEPLRPLDLLPTSLTGAAIFALVFVGVTFTPLGDLVLSANAALIRTMTLVTSIALLIFGPLVSVIASPRQAQPHPKA